MCACGSGTLSEACLLSVRTQVGWLFVCQVRLGGKLDSWAAIALFFAALHSLTCVRVCMRVVAWTAERVHPGVADKMAAYKMVVDR